MGVPEVAFRAGARLRGVVGPTGAVRGMIGNSAMTINLASEPFRRERARNAALVAACAVLLISLIALVSMVLHERGRAAKLRKEIEVQRVELAKYQRDQARFRSILGKPENTD